MTTGLKRSENRCVDGWGRRGVERGESLRTSGGWQEDDTSGKLKKRTWPEDRDREQYGGLGMK